MTSENRTKFDEELFAPRPGEDPERVDTRVVENEMAAFRTFTTQVEV